MKEIPRITVTLLGTGTSQGVPVIGCRCEVCSSHDYRDKRLRSSALLNINGKNFVIDAGPDFRQQMLSWQVGTLRAILISHEHVDHIFGLDDIRSYNWIQKRPTDIYAEHRVLEAIRHIFHYVFARDKYPGIPQMELHNISESPFTIDEIVFTPIRGYHHKLPVLGFRVGNFTYITDVNSISGHEMEKIKGTKVLVINALRKEKHLSHFNLYEALKIAEELKPDQTFLTHISHAMGLYTDVEKNLPEGISLAYDGLSFEV